MESIQEQALLFSHCFIWQDISPFTVDNISKKPRQIQVSFHRPAASECEWQVTFSLSKGAGNFFTILLSEEGKKIFFSTSVRKNQSPARLETWEGTSPLEAVGLGVPVLV